MDVRRLGSRAGGFRTMISPRAFTRSGLVACIAVMMVMGGAGRAVALEEGEYTMQCSCPVWWEGDWDGNGVFNEDKSLDIIALANGTSVLLMHELPVDAMSLEDYAEARTESLEDNPNIEDVEIVWDDETADSVILGRSWVNAEGDTVLSWQMVMVWETNFLLSVEFVAPEDEFEDVWVDALGDIAVVGMPIPTFTNTDDVMENFGL